jgi:hypothetical protein
MLESANRTGINVLTGVLPLKDILERSLTAINSHCIKFLRISRGSATPNHISSG